MSKAIKMYLVILCLALTSHYGFCENIVFPEDAKVADVKRDYGAKGDGKADDTSAIQKALSEKRNLIYFPNGTYLVSDTLRWGDRQTRQTFQGQSEKGVIIKLKDNCDGYGNPASPKAVIWTGRSPAQRFRNSIRNLTVDTGKGNPGATGIQYIANNQGCMRHVTIKSGDGRGVKGLDLGYTNEQGPCMIEDIHVIGFDIGVFNKHAVDSVVMADITVEKQNKYGSVNDGQVVTIDGFYSKNKVPAFFNKKGASFLTLVNAKCEGGDPKNTAVINEADMFLRNLSVSGYGIAINNAAGNQKEVKGPKVEEFTSHPVNSLFPSPPRSLNLPVKKTPDVPWHDLKDWVSVNKYPPKKVKYKRKDGKTMNLTDWTESIQKAIDSGAKTVYFPGSNYQILGTVYLRGNVERLHGLENSWRNASGAPKGKIVIDDGKSPVVVMEYFDVTYAMLTYVHKSKRIFVMRSVSHNEWTRIEKQAGSGDLFLDDTGGGEFKIFGGNVWARNLNMEGERIKNKIRNENGNLWILGYKTEGDTLLLDNLKGAKTEIVGGFIYANKANDPKKVMFVNDATSSLSFSIGEWVGRHQPFAPVRETRNGVTKTLSNKEVSHRGEGASIPLYVGYRKPAAKIPGELGGLSGEALGTSEVKISWQPVSGNVDGYAVELLDPAGKPARKLLVDKSKTDTSIAGLKAGAVHKFKVAAFNGKGLGKGQTTSVKTKRGTPPGKGTGLRGDYYNSKYLTKFIFTRTDPKIEFDWSKTPPKAGMKSGDMAVRLTGEIEPRYTETYRFDTPKRGDTRLWVDGKLVFNGIGRRSWGGSIKLEAGKRVPIKLEVRNGNPVKLVWKSKNQASEVVPTSQLYPASKTAPEYTIKPKTKEISEKKAGEFSIIRKGPTDQAVTLEYKISGSANGGKDYAPLSGKATIPAGKTEAKIAIKPVDDDWPEKSESVTIELPLSADYNLAGGAESITIKDDDLPPPGKGDGLVGEYFNDTKFAKSVGKRTDSKINFGWNKKAPIKGVKPKRTNRDKGYSIRWTGKIQPHYSETYQFETAISRYGGARVWIDGKQVINAWDKRGIKTGKIKLEGGKKYDIKVDFSHRNFYDGRIKLIWSSPKQFKETVPTSQLFTK